MHKQHSNGQVQLFSGVDRRALEENQAALEGPKRLSQSSKGGGVKVSFGNLMGLGSSLAQWGHQVDVVSVLGTARVFGQLGHGTQSIDLAKFRGHGLTGYAQDFTQRCGTGC